ncbi:phosphoenolpyruvate--protein phosphotransferase [Pelomicrobium methylotrophicum]|uniref:Phosphoenolpyruvate-protein phosphotransferase n=1 Tax=Pelomicrobium methylotrophicum TaxID=2602750 RepID=A0A5C7EN50_9PROT|nr:phosphoenolpyruvate--protein phosphotransferase [Pelomicrobium methylotrophicum]TXF12678.1 phosphoenolpyruvate--protein phosphotransferase [Pelomicrobium methylotrophicum]
MSFTLHGTGVSQGIAIGRAHLASHASLEVAHYTIPESRVADEVARFKAAVKAARSELIAQRKNLPPSAPAELEAFLNVHLMILDDEILSRAPVQRIRSQRCNAEWALRTQMDALIAQFDEMENEYLRERRNDVVQVVERIMKALLGQPPAAVPAPPTAGEPMILVARDLSPADVMIYKQHQFSAFITDLGGATSHTAIVARSLGIPSIVALHHARQLIRENDLLIVDGTAGVVVVNPDKSILAEYELRRHQWELERQKLKRLKSARAVTLDGVPVELQANIELPEDVEQAKENGATGIGLFRSEFLFLNRDELPSEDEQFEAYRQVVRQMKGLPVTIRTLDLGADKHLNGAQRFSTNPALGLRAIRLCLAEPQMFRTQLRAILRASHYGRVRILLPMLSSLSELTQAMHMIEQAKRELADERVKFDPNVQVGGMIEVPAAALMLEAFLRRLHFLSIGTNDLIQYTLAIDRTDDTVAHLYDPLHPAVLYLVARVIRTANRAGVPVAVCGEMAGDVALTRLLLGFGLREFSMHPSNILAVKQQVLRTALSDIAGLTQKMLKVESHEKLLALLERLNA